MCSLLGRWIIVYQQIDCNTQSNLDQFRIKQIFDCSRQLFSIFLNFFLQIWIVVLWQTLLAFFGNPKSQLIRYKVYQLL